MSPPIVMVAGLGVSSRYWVPLARRLASRFHVLAPDLPGFGLTPAPPGADWPSGPDVRTQAGQLLAWLDARGLQRVILCGHSLGCIVAAEVAARCPERVEKLILAAPVYECGARTTAQQLARLIVAELFDKPSLKLLLNVEYGSVGLARIIEQAARTLGEPIEARLPHITSPTLVMRGSCDPLVSRTWAAHVATALPRGGLVEIERVGHAHQYSAARVTADVITQFATGALDVERPPRHRTIVSHIDDAQADPLGPPQPISPGLHAAIDLAASVAAWSLPGLLGLGWRSRAALRGAAAIMALGHLVTDHRGALTRRIPVVAHINADVQMGTALLFSSLSWLRREPRIARLAVAGLGIYQIAAAALTAKPTGPARFLRVPRARVLPPR